MNILHIYSKNNELIHKHVQLLVEGLRQSANVQVADNAKSFYQQARDMQADIIHVHGVNQLLHTKALRCAQKLNIRYVITLHGQMQPFALEQLPPQQRVAMLLYLRDFIQHAYSIITFGKMETSSFSKFGWNPRIEEIRNAVTTNTITPAEMASQTFAVYQKVMDSNVLEQMNETTQQLLAVILKAGITGDRRWVQEPVVCGQETDWRRLLIYAEHHHIRNYVDYGISTLGLETPNIDTSKITAYFPDNWQQPVPLKEIIGEYKGDETDYLVRMIRQIEKQPLLLHLVELARELRRDTVDDDLLQQALEEKKLLKYASRLMQILQEQTRLEEGYMPLPSTNDRGTQQIRKLITNQMTI